MTASAMPGPESLPGREQLPQLEGLPFKTPEQASMWLLAASEVLAWSRDESAQAGIEASNDYDGNTFSLKLEDGAGGTYRVAMHELPRGYTQTYTGKYIGLKPYLGVSIAYTIDHGMPDMPVTTTEVTRHETTRNQRKRYGYDTVEYGLRTYEEQPSDHIPSVGQMTTEDQRRKRTEKDVDDTEEYFLGAASLFHTMVTAHLSENAPELLEKIEKREAIRRGYKAATLLHKFRLRSDTSG
jgi:hypothetical protein